MSASAGDIVSRATQAAASGQDPAGPTLRADGLSTALIARGWARVEGSQAREARTFEQLG